MNFKNWGLCTVMTKVKGKIARAQALKAYMMVELELHSVPTPVQHG
jgi:hypothetical protein